MHTTNNSIAADLYSLNGNDTTRFKDHTLWMIYHDIEFDPDTMENLQYGSFIYALYQRDHIPYVLVQFGELIFEFDINGYHLFTSCQRPIFKEYAGKTCFSLVDPGSKKIIAERHFYFNAHFVAHLKSCLQEQWDYYHSEAEVTKKIMELTEFLVTEEMFAVSTPYCEPAVNEYTSDIN